MTLNLAALWLCIAKRVEQKSAQGKSIRSQCNAAACCFVAQITLQIEIINNDYLSCWEWEGSGEAAGKGVYTAPHGVSLLKVGFARGWFTHRWWICAWMIFPGSVSAQHQGLSPSKHPKGWKQGLGSCGDPPKPFLPGVTEAWGGRCLSSPAATALWIGRNCFKTL